MVGMPILLFLPSFAIKKSSRTAFQRLTQRRRLGDVEERANTASSSLSRSREVGARSWTSSMYVQRREELGTNVFSLYVLLAPSILVSLRLFLKERNEHSLCSSTERWLRCTWSEGRAHSAASFSLVWTLVRTEVDPVSVRGRAQRHHMPALWRCSLQNWLAHQTLTFVGVTIPNDANSIINQTHLTSTKVIGVGMDGSISHTWWNRKQWVASWVLTFVAERNTRNRA